MVFPLGAWCPSVGKGRKGKEDGHQVNRLYSYSTYVLKSIHKRCSTVFLVAGRVQAAAEKAHSRKLTLAISRSIHPYRGVREAYIERIRRATGIYSSVCCEDLLRGATGCCSRVAGELVLCSPARVVWTNVLHRTFVTGERIRGLLVALCA